ncbi:MAG: apolipoprotein N-acyltransferase [Candidatus Endonucleobacter bathymodioli]|uniref:Apolipoprotein N-acyltransferase n=1 Tax=Candidatus Endonucleibacter bathymodioli TaxID=539814 RepID=A0AA90P204_9GAMM|nr:apolipoprotein N-acyltransferase [Candidatus Endonucleobacter bathymodioli]
MREKQKKYIISLLCLLSGATLTLGFSPFDLWLIAMVSIASIFLLIRNECCKRATINGFLFGVGMFGAGTSWVYISIHQFGAASVPLASLLTALFVGGISLLCIVPLFWLYSQLVQRWRIQYTWQQALLFSALWTLFEWVRCWLFTGFPWLLVGYTLLDTPSISWAPVTGVYGLSFLLLITSTIAASFLAAKGRQLLWSSATAMVVIGCWLTALYLANIQWTKPVSKLEFSAIQGNIPQSLKWDAAYLQNTISTYRTLTSLEWQQDLIVWPENAIPVSYSSAKDFLKLLDREAKSKGATLVTGIPIDDLLSGGTQYYNGVISIGQGAGEYHKQKLVPFGEYVPFEALLRGLISFFDLPMSNFSTGADNQPPLMVGKTIIAPYICYEVVYPDFVAKMAQDTGLLITISNDSWFGKSIGPEQHFQMARMRAIETGRYMIRSTNNGITAVINNYGQVVESIPRFEQGVLRGTAKVMSGNTPFMTNGSWPVVVFCILMLLVVRVCRAKV